MKLVLELFLLKVEGDEVRFKRHERDITQAQDDPNDLAEQLLDECARGDGEHGAFVHSSSWRYSSPEAVFLTFFSYSDKFELGPDARSLCLADFDAQKGDSNGGSEVDDVAAHAVRHLAFLLESGEVEEELDAFSPESLRALRGVQRELAGVILKGRA